MKKVTETDAWRDFSAALSEHLRKTDAAFKAASDKARKAAIKRHHKEATC